MFLKRPSKHTFSASITTHKLCNAILAIYNLEPFSSICDFLNEHIQRGMPFFNIPCSISPHTIGSLCFTLICKVQFSIYWF